MKVLVSLVAILLLSSVAHSQSGRRPTEIKVPVPLPAEEAPGAAGQKTLAAEARASSVTAERNQDYRCADDGTLERILETAEGAMVNPTQPSERILSSKETDSRVVITDKPKPGYTKEARRNGIQGFVALKLLLSGSGRVTRVKIIKGLPAGLTENAMRAGCRMKFKPATKDGEPVSQWVLAEYAFRLSDSSIFRP